MDNVQFNNYGWYVVPFSVDTEKIVSWQKYLDFNFEETESFIGNNYLFSYITKMFRGDEKSISTYSVPDELISNVSFLVKGINVPDDVCVQDANIYMCAPYLGLLAYKISYGSLSVDEIIDFSYAQKRLRLPVDKSTITQNTISSLTEKLLQCNLNNIDDDNALTKAFFYTSGRLSHCCVLFQHVVTPISDDQTINHQKFLLSHGYSHSFYAKISDEYAEETDWSFSPYPYITWAGTQNVVSNLCVSSKAPDEKALSFLGSPYDKSICNDYYCMFLLLLVQRFTLLYWTANVHKAGRDIKYLEEADSELTKFKMCVSYNVISDEMTYQTIYSRARKVLNIAELTDDLSDVGSKLLENSREEDAKRESRMGNSLIFLQLLALGSALLDISDFFNDFSSRSVLSNTISIGICVVLIIWAIVSYKRNG